METAVRGRLAFCRITAACGGRLVCARQRGADFARLLARRGAFLLLVRESADASAAFEGEGTGSVSPSRGIGSACAGGREPAVFVDGRLPFTFCASSPLVLETAPFGESVYSSSGFQCPASVGRRLPTQLQTNDWQ